LTNPAPKGTVYTGTTSTYEYQLFPEAYFSGADVKIYFGDTWVDDIMGITFVIQEPVKPLYSYKSRTFKEVSRGARIVNGRFYMAFRKAGYISSVLDHLAQLGNISQQENEIVSIMAGGATQPWHGKALSTIESIMSYYKGDIQERYAAYEKEVWGRRKSNDPNEESKTYFYRSRTKADLQQVILREGFDIFITYGPLEQALQSQGSTPQSVSFNTTVKAIRGVQLISESQDVTPDGTVVCVIEFLAQDID
jgi:hypothetical protein